MGAIPKWYRIPTHAMHSLMSLFGIFSPLDKHVSGASVLTAELHLFIPASLSWDNAVLFAHTHVSPILIERRL